ncbi:MAG: prenyltransferase/squalene oxidase repeat-containing protein, partial [Planctomycetota bacterium]
ALAGDEAEQKLKAGDRDPAFLLRVNQAVRKGMEFLITQQKEDGSFTINFSKEFPGAPTAFALLALLKAGVPRNDAVIEKGFAFLRRTPLKKVYTVAFTILALEARWSKQEVDKRMKGQTRAVKARPKIPRNDLDWMKDLVRFLLSNMTYEQDMRDETGAITGKKNCWRYPGPAEVGDHSNTQYALLALRAAKTCGIQVPPEIFADIIDHFVKTQEKDGPQVVRFRMIEDSKHGYVSYRPATSVPDRARGWCYSTYHPPQWGGDANTATTGSMTTVGVACLIISMDCLMGNSKLNAKRMGEAKRSIHDGLAWLNHHFTVEKNPGYKEARWTYYYLYGLERAAVLAGTRCLGKHDWYREGAEWLMKHQAKDGAWRHVSAGVVPGTGFALLFLTRATIPGRVKITR